MSRCSRGTEVLPLSGARSGTTQQAGRGMCHVENWETGRSDGRVKDGDRRAKGLDASAMLSGGNDMHDRSALVFYESRLAGA